MKRMILLLAAATILFSACGVSSQASKESKEEAQRTAQAVWNKLDERSFTIDVTYMIPMRGHSKSVTGYFLSIDGTNINSGLPYFGVAHSAPYGGGKGLSFEDKIQKYEDLGVVKDSRTIKINVRNEEDAYEYTITVYNSGDADIHVHCDNRDDISFRGRLNMDEKED